MAQRPPWERSMPCGPSDGSYPPPWTELDSVKQRRIMAGRKLFNAKPKQRAASVEAARARWGLDFNCWRNVLVLSAATAATVDTILAIAGGRPSHTLGPLIALLTRW